MTINVFEGARRIAKLLAALWVVGWVIAAFYVSPSVDAKYKIIYPGGPLLNLTGECPSDGITELVEKETTKATRTLVTLCFTAQTFHNGDRLIPYFVLADGNILGREKYSTEVSEYTKRVAENFAPPKADEKSIDKQWWPLFLKEIGWRALGAVSGLLFLFAFTWTMG